jgi:hypothetical protein
VAAFVPGTPLAGSVAAPGTTEAVPVVPVLPAPVAFLNQSFMAGTKRIAVSSGTMPKKASFGQRNVATFLLPESVRKGIMENAMMMRDRDSMGESRR